jgi:hypothetical protein
MMGGRAASSNVAGYYRTDSPAGPFAFVPKSNNAGALSPLSVLQHEYTHHLMYSNWGDVVFPGWFSEGFAELFATARLGEDGKVVIGAIPAYRVYGLDQMNRYPVEKLVSGYPNYTQPLDVQIFYGRSWLLTHYMMFDTQRSKALAAYIGAINEGKPAAEANKILGIDSMLDIKLNNYLNRRALPGATFGADQLKIGEVRTRLLTPGEAAVMPMMMRSHNGVDLKQAQEVIAVVRKIAAGFPDDVGAQNELAEAEYDSGNYALCEAAADRVLAVDSKSVHGLIYKGMAQMALLKAAGNTDPAKWTAARRWFLAANKADSLYSYPIQLYYESFRIAKQPATKAAKDGLLFAYQLSPQNMALRLEAARILLDDDRLKAARVALEPIAYNERRGPLADMAKKVIAALDSGGASAAIAAMEAAVNEPKPKQGDADEKKGDPKKP